MRALAIILTVVVAVIIVGWGVMYFAQNGNSTDLSGYQPYAAVNDNGNWNDNRNDGMATSSTSTDESRQDILTVASQTSGLMTFAVAAKEAGLENMLRDGGPYTVFAPTDRAFGQLDQETMKRLTDDKQYLVSVLRNHLVNGAYQSSDLINGGQLRLSSGRSVEVSASGTDMMVGDAKIVAPDIMASNGVIHGIDKVILP